jgi:bacterioferritin-associated ferredoxin
MANAFELNGKPSLLFTGLLLNHSCLPNVIFGLKNKEMVFVAVKNINKGDEICDNYIDITLSKFDRMSQLREQYGFDCQCSRCIHHDEFVYDKIAFNIEKERFASFGFSKSGNLFIGKN